MMAWFCPCYLLARVAEHEGQHVQDSYPQGGWGPKLRVLLPCFLGMFLCNVVRYVHWAMGNESQRGMGLIIDIVRLCLSGIIIVIMMQLRELYRIKHGITNPTDCCGSSDCCCAWFCLPLKRSGRSLPWVCSSFGSVLDCSRVGMPLDCTRFGV